MTDAARAQVFVEKWQRTTLNERATVQEHFVDLCRLLGVPTPNEADTSGAFYRFEKPLTKTGGKAGFADVWMRDHFAWEYKTKGKYPDLRAAYTQLQWYKEDLDNPPILVACDIANYEVHIAFTGYSTRIERFSNADLANVSTRALLRQVFTNPELLRPTERVESITEQVAGRFAQVAQFLERRSFTPGQIAPFFMKVLFALFAEDIKILPNELMSSSFKRSVRNPEQFPERARALLRAMREGTYFGDDRIPRFNGWLFDDDEVLPLNADELQFLGEASRQDWAAVEPAIFGTLFERSLDPSKRSQLGAHYTSRDDILLIVEPVLMAPLRREWDAVRVGIEALRVQWEPLSGNARRRLQSVAEAMLLDFAERLAGVRVLDPACGSGNFLYVALNQLKDLEKEAWQYAGGLGLAQPELAVSPAQLFGIEKNQFAAELAQVVVWIGYLQWLKNNGFLEGKPREPILQALHNIACRDAILTVDLHGNPAEPAWPDADVIIGNPPFLGDKKMRGEMGETYVTALRKLYEGRVPGGADLVTYWFERAREQIAIGKTHRAGLLATQGIRGISNRKVLERIKQTGDIFLAWSDRPWVLDGAAVRVAMVGFDDGSEQEKRLNDAVVTTIHADLSGAVAVATAIPLVENEGICFLGMMKAGPFDIDAIQAQAMLQAQSNDYGRPNSDVIKRRLGGQDVTGLPRDTWIIDFGVDMSEEQSSYYKLPFDYIRMYVKPIRDSNRRDSMRRRWWIHGEPRRGLRNAIAKKNLQRCIVTPEVAKYRIFVWMLTTTVPDHKLHVFVRDDDYFFGLLQSHMHELWAIKTSIPQGDGNGGGRPTYKSLSFETFPFPYPPGTEDQRAAHVIAIAEAARRLVAARDVWLAGGEPGIDDGRPITNNRQPTTDSSLHGAAADSQSSVVGRRSSSERTLTNLYNKRPDWLDLAHAALDRAVFDAYGWPHDLGDDAILERLLALNGERAAQHGAAPVAPVPADADEL